MKPLFALVSTAMLFAASLWAFTNSAEAAFFPGSGMTAQPVVFPVQYGHRRHSPLQPYGPGRHQDSIAARAAYCRCYPYLGFQKRRVCRYPGRPTTVQIVDRCY
jgi:hypothetical protein